MALQPSDSLMPRRHCRGFLLLEAILSAVVIATGLVLISRSLSSQLNALHAIDQYEALLPYAEHQWLEWEALRLATTAKATDPREGLVAGTRVHWRVTAHQRPQEEGASDEFFSDIHMIMSGEERERSLTMEVVWPSTWASEAWYQ